MPKFSVDVTDKAGKRHRSQVEAANAIALRERLEAKGYTINDVRPSAAEPAARVALMEPPSVDDLVESHHEDRSHATDPTHALMLVELRALNAHVTGLQSEFNKFTKRRVFKTGVVSIMVGVCLGMIGFLIVGIALSVAMNVPLGR